MQWKRCMISVSYATVQRVQITSVGKKLASYFQEVPLITPAREMQDKRGCPLVKCFCVITQSSGLDGRLPSFMGAVQDSLTTVAFPLPFRHILSV